MSESTASVTHPVVIAGGGPVGIAVALELASQGVRPVVLERRDRGDYYPARTNLTNLRSMEHFRRWGIADRLRDNDPVGDDFVRSATYVTSLNGYVVADFPRVCAFEDRIPFASDRPEFAPNPAIEKTMHDAATEHPLIDIRFGHTVTAFEELDDSIRVSYTDAGGHHTIDAAYLVAADGSGSQIRHELGIQLQGEPDLVQASFWHIFAPGLKNRMQLGRSSFFWFINEFRDNAGLIAQDSDGHYQFAMIPVPSDMDPDDWQAARQVLYRNVGFEFDVEALSGGRVRIHSLLTPEFRSGRIFLAGDAAHQISPLGGFGMNLGIGDAVDLGWKLAAVLNGWGGPALLDSYGLERSAVISPIQEECIANTNRNPASFTIDGISDDTPEGAALRSQVGQFINGVKQQEFVSFGAQLGTHYHGSPIVVSDGTEPPALSQGDYSPSASPGCRAPHVWLADDTSLYDHFGNGYCLLITRPESRIDTAAFETAATERGIPLEVLAPRHDGLRDLYGADLALIRPDQHVAWRADAVPADPGEILDIVRGAGLHAHSRPMDMAQQTLQGDSGAAIVSPVKFAHAVLRTPPAQFGVMVGWYKTVLGAHASFEVPGALAFLTYDDEHHRIAIGAVPELAERPVLAVGLDHLAFTYASLGDLISTYERLRRLDIHPYRTINHGPTLSFYYRDPDSNQIELQVDVFATTEEVNAFLVAEFPKNPIGVDVDAEELTQRFHSGVPAAELLKRADVGTRKLGKLNSI
ncbi:FAD-dependent monooxygenase [Nocardia sp. CA-129566]|uniref:FAD-dependent monooxygenase n=1 Tax=Nocardia sp. CA-129566 TaxID=3239976 RepID=UPI003D99B231